MEFADLFNLAMDNKFATFVITAVSIYIIKFVIKATIVIALIGGFMYFLVVASNDKYDSKPVIEQDPTEMVADYE